MNRLDKPDSWLIKEAGLGKTAIINGQKRNTFPAVDKAYRCAKALGLSIEELVAGEEGAELVRGIVRNDSRAMRVPDRIRGIAEGLLLLDDDQLVGIEANVAALAGVKRGEEERKAG
ncbi:MAG: helix-turn-helix domain containing protein [Treponema sp.]|nr:helix-turn-helix domain containing protein [Treponema sp.]